MNSTLKIYQQCLIRPNQLFEVDDIEDYLSTLSMTQIDNFQYIRHSLNLKIKVDRGQVYTIFERTDINYCSIKNGVHRPVYYFIVNARQLSEDTIEYELVMDTINTFIAGNDFSALELSQKTKITRQHKDRYEIKEVAQQTGVYKKIDLYSEGISPVLFGEEKNELREDVDLNWYLMYMNQNEPSDSQTNPVNCFLLTDKDLNIATSTFSWFTRSISGTDIQNTLMLNLPFSLYFIGANNKGARFQYRTLDVVMTEADVIEIKFYDTSSPSTIQIVHYVNGSVVDDIAFASGESIDFTDASTLQIGSANNPSYTARSYGDSGLINGGRTATITGLEHIDRTDPRIIKIIKLPYCPVDFDVYQFGGVIDLTTDRVVFEYNDWRTILEQPSYRRLRLLDLNTKFERTIDFEKNGNFNPYEVLKGKSILPKPNITDLRSADNEPKLYHSDFYMPKVIYDSFSFGFQLERVTHQFGQTQPRFNVKYLVTSTINSRFSFTFTDYECSPYNAQDYNNVMCVSRNNEMPIYNQQYINYLRAGFNYDVKSKTRTETFSWIGTGLQVVGAVGAFASSVVTHGVGIAAGVALTTTALGSLASSINTTISSEQNFAAKQEQLKLQATSVYGSDDVDLMSGYSNNRAKIMLYKVSPKMKGLLFDLFHYTGYVADEMGIPNVKTRCRFNFVACEPIYMKTPNIPQDLLEDLNNKLRAGVTFIHHFNDEWDFEQKYENWEVSLLGE